MLEVRPLPPAQPGSDHAAGTLEDGYSIRAADMPGADDLMMRVYAAMAQKERELISERTKAALGAAKARGAAWVATEATGRPRVLTRARPQWPAVSRRSGRRTGCCWRWTVCGRQVSPHRSRWLGH
jgi:hypothetical protein